MPYRRNADLPEGVRSLPTAAQTIWRRIANAAEQTYGDNPERVARTAWAGLKNAGWAKGEDGEWRKVTKICKIDAAQRLVFGWASVAIHKDGVPVEDLQGDLIDPDDLEEAAYAFNLDFREANAEHVGPVVGHLVESLVVTPAKLEAMGLSHDALPQGWWVGFHVPDDGAWARVAAGEYSMFSIEGTAQREEVPGGA
jgi:cation transport regulator ChaB